MDPDKPVLCLWYVMLQSFDWSGNLNPHYVSAGPYEDRTDAEKSARQQASYGNHIVAIVSAIFQEGDYIEGYKPYEAPKPDISALKLNDLYVMNEPLAIDRDLVAREMEGIIRARGRGAAVYDPIVMPFYNDLVPDPVVPAVNPGDGIAVALEAKTARIKQKRPAYLDLAGHADKHGIRGLKGQRGITVSSKSWTGRGKR
jgi:hypothetical protein